MQVRYKAFFIAAGVMILLFLIGGYFGFRTPSEEPRSTVMAFDSTAIVMIEFFDFSDEKNNLQLMRLDNGWERISERTLEWEPVEHAQALLRQFHFIPVKRDMGMIGLVGDRFKLTGDQLSQISFVQADGITHTLNIGSNTFAPGKVGAWTYVNVPDEKIVYAVEGILTSRLRPGSAGIEQ